MNEREDSGQEKTEEPSDERRRQFREEGNVASPREVVHAIALLAFVVSLYFSGAQWANSLTLVFTRSWRSLKPFHTPEEVFGHIWNACAPVLPMLVSFSVLCTVAPLIAGLAFTRFNWSTKAFQPNFGKLNPITGITRVFGIHAIPELVKNLIKMVVLLVTGYYVIRASIIDGSGRVHWDPRLTLKDAASTTMFLLFAVAVASVVIGLGDWAFNWWRTETKMKMSKQELKEEYKKQEGDPHVKGARRRMAREFVMQRSLQKVPQATFVVTNPEHYSVAVRYATGMAAPVVVAKGVDFLALRIREIATKNDIVIVENKPLARTLYKMVDIGHDVPPSLYSAIIEVMKYILQTRGRNYFERFDLLQNSRANA